MVRMCSDGVKPLAQRLGYRNALHGLYRIAKDEGTSRVFRGMGATCLRSVIMNASQLSWCALRMETTVAEELMWTALATT